MSMSIDGVDKVVNYEKINKPKKKNLEIEKNIDQKNANKAIEASLDALGVNGRAGILYTSRDSRLHEDDSEYAMLESKVKKAMINYSEIKQDLKAGVATEEDCEYFRSKLEEAQRELDEYKQAKKAKLLAELSD